MYKRTLLLLGMVAAVSFPTAPGPVDGKWFFRGTAGWQRITFDFDVHSKSLSGTITMGPGVSPENTGAEDWEYFFEPATFPIQHGRFDGTTLTFEQEVARGAQIQPNEMLKYTGRLDGDRIEFVRESSQRIMGKCKLPPEYCIKDTFVLGDHKITFVAQRTSSPAHLPEPLQASPDNSRELKTTGSKSVTSVGSAAHVLLVFDHNRTWFEDSTTEQDSSNYGVREWTGLLISVREFVNQLRPSDSIAVADMENFAEPCIFEGQKVPCTFYKALDWRGAKSEKTDITLGLTKSFPGQKDLYEAIEQATELFAGKTERKIAVLFTDGRDGRLNPRWLRTVSPIRVVTLNSTLPTPGVPDSRKMRFLPTYQDVLDPLFGLPDSGEGEEFDKTLAAAAKSGIEFYFVAIHTGRDPEFGPALVGRRISGLFPGSNEGIDAYLAQARLRMGQLATATGGRVIYGETPGDAYAIYESLAQTLGLNSTASGRKP